MIIDPMYRAQVSLLLSVLPYVAKEKDFALKGGTAINLFVRDMPRLSVDIDLTYVGFEPRDVALKRISETLGRIKQAVSAGNSGISAEIVQQSDGNEAKLTCKSGAAQIKIEVNTTIRGTLFPTRMMQIGDAVQSEFSKFAAMAVVSNAELYGGKICAALDRQHPRDLFDVYHLLENEGFSESIRQGFIALLLSGNRPIHEMIDPQFQDQRSAFEKQFAGMSLSPFTYDDFETTRKRLVKEIHSHLSMQDRQFLLSFKTGNPDWTLFSLATLAEMPAVKWKLLNLQKFIAQNPSKHAEQYDKLKKALAQ